MKSPCWNIHIEGVRLRQTMLDISMLGLYLAATFCKTSEVRKNPRSIGPKESEGTQTKTFV